MYILAVSALAGVMAAAKATHGAATEPRRSTPTMGLSPNPARPKRLGSLRPLFLPSSLNKYTPLQAPAPALRLRSRLRSRSAPAPVSMLNTKARQQAKTQKRWSRPSRKQAPALRARRLPPVLLAPAPRLLLPPPPPPLPPQPREATMVAAMAARDTGVALSSPLPKTAAAPRPAAARPAAPRPSPRQPRQTLRKQRRPKRRRPALKVR